LIRFCAIVIGCIVNRIVIVIVTYLVMTCGRHRRTTASYPLPRIALSGAVWRNGADLWCNLDRWWQAADCECSVSVNGDWCWLSYQR